MKFRHISIAVAAVIAAASASATPQTDAAAAFNAGNYISIAGASAAQAGFEALIGTVLTAPKYFADKADITKANYIAALGTLKTAAGAFTATTNVAILYRVAGGSFNGVYPVIRATSIDALDLTACTAAGTGTGLDPYICPVRGPAANAANPALNAAGVVPDAGISDVEPKFFKVTDNLEGETVPTAVNDTELKKVVASALYAQAFGLPVTRNVSSGMVFTPAIYNALMAGAFTDWNQVPGSTDSGPIVICRRIPGSGSQAVINLFSGNAGCAANSNSTATLADRSSSAAYTGSSYVAANVGTSSGTGLIVIENNASGDVRSCMDAAVQGGSLYSTKDRSSSIALPVDFGAGGYKAIGVLSMDSVDKSAATATTVTAANIGGANGQWQFRSFYGTGTVTAPSTLTSANATTPVGITATGTGILPTVANVQVGDWPIIAYESFNIPTRVTGDKKTVLNRILAAGQQASVLRGLKALSWSALALPDGITGLATAASDTPNVLQALRNNGDVCSPLLRAY
jgi:hypothetical protein